MSKYEFEANGDKIDWVLAEADDLTGRSLVHFTGRYGGGVDLVVVNSIYNNRYSFRLKFHEKQIRDFLAEGVREMHRVQQALQSNPNIPGNVFPLRPR